MTKFFIYIVALLVIHVVYIILASPLVIMFSFGEMGEPAKQDEDPFILGYAGLILLYIAYLFTLFKSTVKILNVEQKAKKIIIFLTIFLLSFFAIGKLVIF